MYALSNRAASNSMHQKDSSYKKNQLWTNQFLTSLTIPICQTLSLYGLIFGHDCHCHHDHHNHYDHSDDLDHCHCHRHRHHLLQLALCCLPVGCWSINGGEYLKSHQPHHDDDDVIYDGHLSFMMISVINEDFKDIWWLWWFSFCWSINGGEHLNSHQPFS